MAINHPIPRGTLWQRLRERTETAITQGALQRIVTQAQTLNDHGIAFVLYIAENLQRKTRGQYGNDAKDEEFNPFLPPEPALTIGAIGKRHLAVLNKFNVVEHHLLLVTRLFEPQEALLTLSDFEALCWSLREIDGLGFYNGGTIAGASQRHKHLQLIPMLQNNGRIGMPVEQIFPTKLSQQPTSLAALPFRHRIVALPSGLFEAPAKAAEVCHRLYHEMLQTLHITPIIKAGTEYQSAPYNLLLTRRWLMLVPRSREHVAGISINAMGFAGSFFVKNPDEQKRLAAVGPLHVLCAASYDKNSSVSPPPSGCTQSLD